MTHRIVTIPETSEKPRFYPAQKTTYEGWIGIADSTLADMAGSEYYQNVSGARAKAAKLMREGTRIDAIVYVSVSGHTILKLEGDSREVEIEPEVDTGCNHPDFGSW